MYSYKFKCTFLSDVVLSSSSATEGFHDSLDYIPGVKFLGIVAQKYYKTDTVAPEKIKTLFHSKAVQFGNAYPLLGESAAVPVPFSWRQRKDKSITESSNSDKNDIQNGQLFVHGQMEDHEEKAISKEGQLKQVRQGFVSLDCQYYTSLSSSFSIKSAYDRGNRKSKDSAMFGYFALPKGSEYTFDVKVEDKALAEEIRNTLIGVQRIGRSRSAQYGLVDISFLGEEELQEETLSKGSYWLYAKSDCAFYDEFGNPTLTPTAQDLGLPEGSTICWEKTQLRNKSYQNRNAHRRNFDTERLVIEKGSVWCVDVPTDFNNQKIIQGVGTFCNEGLGELMINPSFLVNTKEQGELNFKLQKWETEAKNKETATTQSVLVDWIIGKNQQKKEGLNLQKEASDFIKQFGEIYYGKNPLKNAQWGKIRASSRMFLHFKDLEFYLFDEEFGYTQHGTQAQQWRQNSRRYHLQQKMEEIYNKYGDEKAFEFTQYLASAMTDIPKQND